MAIPRYSQDPNEYLDYEIDWSQWLPQGDTITESTFTADVGLDVSVASHTTTATIVWVGITGGEAMIGQSFNVVNDIVTAEGRMAERSISIQVKQL